MELVEARLAVRQGIKHLEMGEGNGVMLLFQRSGVTWWWLPSSLLGILGQGQVNVGGFSKRNFAIIVKTIQKWVTYKNLMA